MNKNNTNTVWSRDFILILIINGANSISYHIIAPVLPVYAMRLGFSESLIGVMAASLAFGAFVSRPFVGLMVDRLDHRKINICSLLITSAAVIVLDRAFTPYALIGIRFFNGLLFGLNSTVTMTMAAFVTPEEKMGRGIGILGITGVGSQAVAPAMGLFIVERWGYSALFLFTAAVTLLAACPALILKDRSKCDKNAAQGLPKNKFSVKNFIVPSAAAFSLVGFLFTCATASILSFMVLYGLSKNIADVGFYFSIYASVLILTRLFGGAVTDKQPFRRIVYACASVFTVSLVLMSLAESFSVIAFVAVLMGMAHGVITPTVQTAGIRISGADKRGAAVATVYIGFDLANVFGPLLMGSVTEAAGYGAGFISLCVPVIAAVPVAYFLTRKYK